MSIQIFCWLTIQYLIQLLINSAAGRVHVLIGNTTLSLSGLTHKLNKSACKSRLKIVFLIKVIGFTFGLTTAFNSLILFDEKNDTLYVCNSKIISWLVSNTEPSAFLRLGRQLGGYLEWKETAEDYLWCSCYWGFRLGGRRCLPEPCIVFFSTCDIPAFSSIFTACSSFFLSLQCMISRIYKTFQA